MEFKKEELIKSPLNYTGGKFRILPQILPLFPERIDTFVDLFAGGCNVGINIKANKIICNDFMTQIIDLYKTWQLHTTKFTYEHIYNRIVQFNLSKTNQEGYLKLRELYNKERNPLDLYVLICYSFNNQIRFNSKGGFNIPFGKDRGFNVALQDRLMTFIDKIDNITFINKSFEDVNIENLSKDSLVYCDPPYLISTATYNESGGWNEQYEQSLLNKLDFINKKDVKFALNNVLEHKGKSNDILKKWSKKYKIYHLSSNYWNCNYRTKDRQSKSDEVLITNY